MYIRIDLREFPSDYECKCGQKPEYVVRVLEYPVEEEVPYVSWACKECLVKTVESYRDLINTYMVYRIEYEAEMRKLRVIRFDDAIKKSKEKANASN